MGKEADSILQEMEDAIMELPHGFSIKGKRFRLYPISLGKSMLLSRLLQELGINFELLGKHPAMEALRIASSGKDIVCRIIAYCTAKDRYEVFDAVKIADRQSFFIENLSTEEAAQLLLVVCQYDKAASFIKYLGLDKEQSEQTNISKLKNKNGNSVIFGGKSLYGSLIGIACEKFGWTLDYVVWGISLVNLRMMIADGINSVYLSDDERKSLKITAGQKVINMDDPKSWAMIKSMKWD